MVKAFQLPVDFVVYQMSYVNMVMYGRVLPSYDRKPKEDEGARDDEKTGKEDRDVVDAGNPRNRGKVRSIIENMV